MAKNWKAVERKIAEILGGERVPVSGRTRGWAPDILHPLYALEVKSRLRIPALLVEGMDQAVKAAEWAWKREGVKKLPVLIIHKDGTAYDNSLVVIRLKDIQEWYGFGKGRVTAEDGKETTQTAKGTDV